jgi:hypothetical protein
LLLTLVILALSLMPVGMRGVSAMAMAPAANAMSHCMQSRHAPDDRSRPQVDCMTACAAITEAGACPIAAPLPYPAPVGLAAVAGLRPGPGPDAAIPPPRLR